MNEATGWGIPFCGLADEELYFHLSEALDDRILLRRARRLRFPAGQTTTPAQTERWRALEASIGESEQEIVACCREILRRREP